MVVVSFPISHEPGSLAFSVTQKRALYPDARGNAVTFTLSGHVAGSFATVDGRVSDAALNGCNIVGGELIPANLSDIGNDTSGNPLLKLISNGLANKWKVKNPTTEFIALDTNNKFSAEIRWHS